MNLNEIFADEDLLEKLNSMTKYPSILTYNALGGKGGMAMGLCDSLPIPFSKQPRKWTVRILAWSLLVMIM